MPAHNRGEWQAKFARTKARDSAVDQLLRARGLRVITVWECETKDTVSLKERLISHLR